MRNIMSACVGYLKKYWKQITAIAGFAVVSVIALSVAFASPYDVAVERPLNDEGTGYKNTWDIGYSENWRVNTNKEGIDLNEVDLVWTVEDANVLSLTSNDSSINDYTVTAVGGGSTSVTVKYVNKTNSTIEGSQTINISVNIKCTNTTSEQGFSHGFIYFDGNINTFTIKTNVVSTNQTINWTSSDNSVATVDANGIVSAGTAGGIATITGVLSTGDQAVSVQVVKKAEFNSTAPNSISIGANEYYNIFEITNIQTESQLKIAADSEDYIKDMGGGYIMGVNSGMKSVYIYPNIDYAAYDPGLAGATPAQLAATFGSSKTVTISFGIASSDLTGAVGDTVQLRVNTTEEDARGVNWTSNNTTVATVDTNGLVKFVGSGVAKITATLDNVALFPGDTTNHTSSINVTVVDSFALSMNSNIINVGDSFELEALVTDQNASVVWFIENQSEGIVSYVQSEETSRKITVTGLKKGVGKIKAMQEVNGVQKFAYCEVNVKEPVQDIVLYPTNLSITIGDQYPLTLRFEPELPDNMQVKWVSSNENVVTVTSTGIVSGVGGGDAVVSVISMDGIKVASCDVHVRVPVTGIRLSQTMVETNLSARNHQLSYTITPEGDGVDRSVIWSSSNEQVLTVDQNGFVTFISPGKATVICQTNDIGVDGNNLIATCEYFIYEPVTSVSIDYTDVTLKIGENFRLTAEVLPTNATDKSVTWISSNTSVVTVDENGMLTAVGSGSAAVLVQSVDSGVTAMCNVNVYQPVETVTMNYTEMSVRKGTIFWLNAVAGPENAVNKTILWTTSDSKIATVDDSGKVTTVNPGECIITATSQDTGVFATCKLTVTEPVTGITLNYTDMFIYTGEKFVLLPNVTPIDADNKAVTYLSSDPSVATVDGMGIVTGVKGGSCVILVTTVERGLVASCQVTVYEFVTSVKINEKDVKYINIGSSKSFTASVTPDSATNRGVIWSSSNPNILSVSQKGVVTAKGLGTATITATAADGSGIYDSVVLTSITPVSSINVSPSYVTVREGQTAQVTATITPGNATIKDIDWSSSDPSVASVDYNGEITGVSAGICYVYATSTDGNDIVGKVKVTVKKAVPATSVVINATSVTMFPNQTRALSVRLKPSTSTDGYTWVSSDTSVATVDQKGVVTARGQGNCVIYCVADSGVEDECEVNVLALNSSKITLEQYDNYQLDVYGCTDKITWYTNNNRIATVDKNGQVIARGVGSTTIVAKVNGKLLYCKVTVTKIQK